MAYNDDSVLARLSSLNESHDSIATAAQWIMFHRRHADRTVQLWMQRLKESSSTRRLSLVYLANEVVQQSRIRHKEDFVIAFSPVVAEATSIAYKGAPTEIQAKLKRVVDVWKDRSIFEAPIQGAIEARLEELDKARGTVKPAFGGSPFGGSSLPSEFTPLVSSHQKVAKLSAPLQTTITSANQEYDKYTSPNTIVPSAPVYAARLNGLLKTLANAESAVAECVKAREGLVSGLEKMLESNRGALESDKSTAAELLKRKEEIEEKKQEVEMAIMRALGPADGNGSQEEGGSASPPPEPDRPEMEALTPPAIDDDAMETVVVPSPPEAPSDEVLKAETPPDVAPALQSVTIATNGSNKRRRIDSGDEFPDLDGDGEIDAEVKEMLKDED
ncbi:hypothetical protein L249_8158 [Ophiocordyceps polyrhachis-furcata BCC 54312]|uniref:CID domain-containing protein n=1 Tax=Ophiocordyceps polyrhachis-furcata BCC 54312 TaxID=1330021 RepID=A0A367LH18_9HYPO|nr:hypothetical protein L249_8158 [Ophiocordyceps polyrhachis-furcata BCC 54312]